MPLILQGATSGQATVQATDAATVTLTLPASSGTLVVTGGAQTIEFADGSASAPSITNSGDTNTGMFFPAADTIAFTEGGTESMRIDASGNVGIGTSSPAAKLDVNGTARASSGDFGAVSGDLFLSTMNRAGQTAAPTLDCQSSTKPLVIVHDNAQSIIFGTSNAERFRIASSGETTFTKDTFFTNTNFAGRLGAATGYGYWSNSDVSSYIQINGPSNASVPYAVYVSARINGVILADGASSWAALSDSRLKNVTGKYDNALADIALIEPIKFTWKSDEENKPQVGVIAQSVFPVVPEAIDYQKLVRSEDETEYMSVRYTELIPLMIASIQELNAKVDAQATTVQEQQAIITDLKARIETLENT
jgi:hypothetical protein